MSRFRNSTNRVPFTRPFVSMNRRVAQSDQDQGIVSQSGSGAEIVVFGVEHIAQKWTMPLQNWKAVLQRFAILLGDRVPQDALA